MRRFLLVTLLCCSLTGVASAAIPPGCLNCRYYPHVCVVVVWNGHVYTYCVDVSGGTGTWLEPKPEYQNLQSQSLTPSTNMTLTLNNQVNALGLAKVLNEATGWGVDVAGAGMTGPFPAGTYSGSLTQVVQQIAASGNAGVQIDEANHKLIFGLPVFE